MKITLDSIVSGFKSVTKLISNFDKIEDDLNNKVLYRDNPEGEPNYMQNDLDMNSYNIINQGNPVEVSGFNWLGDWSSLTTYAVGDAVHSNGTAYIAIAASTNQTPPNGTYWQIVAEANYPTQTGNADKALTTDGSAVSWGSIHADHVDFTNSGTGGVERTLQAKLEDVVNVKDFGAVGDGVTDDTAAIQAAVDFCVTNKSVLDLGVGTYLISSPLVFLNPIRIEGKYSRGETVYQTSIKKAVGFSGSAALIAGDGVTGLQGFHLEGVYIDGNSQTGDGLVMTKCANSTLKDIASEHNLGVGLVADGVWISNWYNLAIRENIGGGVDFRGDNREISNIRLFGLTSNQNATYQLKYSGTTGDVIDVSIHSIILELPSDDSPLFICERASKCQFFGGTFAQQINKDGFCVDLGTASHSVDNITFMGVYFQYNPTDTSRSAINLDNADSISFVECFNQGSGKYIQAPLTATALSNIRVNGGDFLPSDIVDPSNVVHQSSGKGYSLADLSNDGRIQLNNDTNGKRLDISVRDSSGSLKSLRIGQGADNDEIGFDALAIRTVVQTVVPNSPQRGRIEYADGVTWDPLALAAGSGYMVRYTGSAWVGLHQKDNGTNIT